MQSTTCIIKYVLIAITGILAGCSKQKPLAVSTSSELTMETLSISADFGYETTRPIRVLIDVEDVEKQPIRGVKIDVYNRHPDNDGNRLASGASDLSGQLELSLTVPSFMNEIVIKTDYIGLPNDYIIVPIINGLAKHAFGNDVGLWTNASQRPIAATRLLEASADEYVYLGSWNSAGVPDYLEPVRDVINSDLLADINASLPEGRPVPDYHPDYIVQGTETNVVLQEDADLWVTFVHEGAGWTNTLGYYTYPVGSPPSSQSDITTHRVVFPNVSYQGSGGGLRSGDKVHLGRFTKDTVVGWFLVARGWQGGGVGSGIHTVYSNSDLNPESDPALQQHNVLLNDPQRDLLLLGFEDVRRDNIPFDCDNDFNDAVFYVTANPATAVTTQNLAPIDTPTDTDGDGISDVFDDFLHDPTRAYLNHFPAENVYGTLAFEDLWPSQGDYDFNDLVVGYNFQQIADTDNKVIGMSCRFKINAIGAGYRNGFGFQLPIPSSSLTMVSDYSGSRIESGNQAVIIVFDNANDLMSTNRSFVNTEANAPYVSPVSVNIEVSFVNPISSSVVAGAPYNPFLTVNLTRDHEIHLPDNPPTSRANNNRFQTYNDNSDPGSARYYKTHNHLPWAINIPESWDHPLEKTPILNAYPYFGDWAESAGAIFSDWYRPIGGYRNETLIIKDR